MHTLDQQTYAHIYVRARARSLLLTLSHISIIFTGIYEHIHMHMLYILFIYLFICMYKYMHNIRGGQHLQKPLLRASLPGRIPAVRQTQEIQQLEHE